MNIAATAAFLQSRSPESDPNETGEIVEQLAQLAKRIKGGRNWKPMDLSEYGLETYECYDPEGNGMRLSLSARDGAEPVAWGRELPGVWFI